MVGRGERRTTRADGRSVGTRSRGPARAAPCAGPASAADGCGRRRAAGRRRRAPSGGSRPRRPGGERSTVTKACRRSARRQVRRRAGRGASGGRSRRRLSGRRACLVRSRWRQPRRHRSTRASARRVLRLVVRAPSSSARHSCSATRSIAALTAAPADRIEPHVEADHAVVGRERGETSSSVLALVPGGTAIRGCGPVPRRAGPGRTDRPAARWPRWIERVGVFGDGRTLVHGSCEHAGVLGSQPSVGQGIGRRQAERPAARPARPAAPPRAGRFGLHHGASSRLRPSCGGQWPCRRPGREPRRHRAPPGPGRPPGGLRRARARCGR